MKSYTIHLIRHGVAEGNLKGQYIGVTDSPLSQQGKQALLEQDRATPYPGAALFFTSPLTRCKETFSILYPDVTPTVIDDFAECDFGAFEGKTAKELQGNPTFLQWMEGNPQLTPPGGESTLHFVQRTCAAFEKLVEDMMRSGKTSAVVVAHGGTIMAICSAYGLPRAPFYDWMCAPGCGYSLRITPSLWMRDMVAEIYETIPPREGIEREYSVLDYARAAASEIFKKQQSTEALD